MHAIPVRWSLYLYFCNRYYIYSWLSSACDDARLMISILLQNRCPYTVRTLDLKDSGRSDFGRMSTVNLKVRFNKIKTSMRGISWNREFNKLSEINIVSVQPLWGRFSGLAATPQHTDNSDIFIQSEENQNQQITHQRWSVERSIYILIQKLTWQHRLPSYLKYFVMDWLWTSFVTVN